MSFKLCQKCGVNTSIEKFSKCRSAKDGLQPKCKDCEKKYRLENKESLAILASKNYYANKPKITAQHQESHLKRTYGITVAQKKELIEKQNGLCPICKQPNPNDVDHDHETGAVRAVLHKECNLALGNIKENFDYALGLAKFIQEHKRIV